MKSIKTLLAASIAASVLSAPVMAEESGVEVSASASIASAYLWRGQDLGDGSPAVSGDLVASMGGLYGGIWGSSGDDASGNEYDLFVGYGMDFGDVSVDLSVWNYLYPDGGEQNGTFGDLSEVILSVGYGPVAVTYYDNVAGASDYSYLTVGAEFGKFSATVGMTDSDKALADSDGNAITDLSTGAVVASTGVDYVHFDISYAYNDNLSFTFSQVIDDDADDTSIETDNDLNFVISYSIPL